MSARPLMTVELVDVASNRRLTSISAARASDPCLLRILPSRSVKIVANEKLTLTVEPKESGVQIAPHPNGEPQPFLELVSDDRGETPAFRFLCQGPNTPALIVLTVAPSNRRFRPHGMVIDVAEELPFHDEPVEDAPSPAANPTIAAPAIHEPLTVLIIKEQGEQLVGAFCVPVDGVSPPYRLKVLTRHGEVVDLPLRISLPKQDAGPDFSLAKDASLEERKKSLRLRTDRNGMTAPFFLIHQGDPTATTPLVVEFRGAGLDPKQILVMASKLAAEATSGGGGTTPSLSLSSGFSGVRDPTRESKRIYCPYCATKHIVRGPYRSGFSRCAKCGKTFELDSEGYVVPPVPVAEVHDRQELIVGKTLEPWWFLLILGLILGLTETWAALVLWHITHETVQATSEEAAVKQGDAETVAAPANAEKPPEVVPAEVTPAKVQQEPLVPLPPPRLIGVPILPPSAYTPGPKPH